MRGLHLGLLMVAASVFGPANAQPAPAPAGGAATTQQQSAAEQAITGTWYGEQAATAKTPLQRFLTTRLADGSYALVARTYAEGKPVAEIRNQGQWGVSNRLFLTVATEINGQRVNPADPAHASIYLVQGFNGREFSYRHLASGVELKVVRAAPDTRLPD